MAKASKKKPAPVPEIINIEANDTSDQSPIIVQTNDMSDPGPVVTIEPAGQTLTPTPAEPATTEIAPPVVTYAIVEAKFKQELTRAQYEQALQSLTSYKITVDNMAEAQLKLTLARKFLNNNFDNIKKAGKLPALTECRYWDDAYNSLRGPLAKEIEAKQKILNDIAAEEARKKKAADDEKARVDGIKEAIDNFLIDQAQAIAGCTTSDELVVIEKLIGSHKANKSRYSEFLPNLVERSEALTTLIKDQKKVIANLEELRAKEKEAEEKKDDATLIEIQDKKDELANKIEENKINVQGAAIKQAMKPESVTIATPIYNTISARRTSWKAELVRRPDGELDKKELEKAFKSGLLVCTIDTDKTRDVLNTLKATGSLKDKTEIIVNGIRYYEEKLY